MIMCCRKVQFFFSLLFLIIISVTPQWAIDDSGCRTPDKGVGECVMVKECKSMMDVLTRGTPLSQNESDILRQYQCGFQGRNVKVCCPATPIILPGSNTNEESLSQILSGINNHKNFKLLPSSCGYIDESIRIFGGNATGLLEFPWMALLSYQIGSVVNFRCGGTIINSRYILTAAHCITKLSTLKLLGVRVGEHTISSSVDCEMISSDVTVCAPPVQDIAIAEIIPHPEYSPTTYMNDIGLLRLAAPINISVDNAKPICLPTTPSIADLNINKDNFTVTGWGVTESGKRSDVLLKVIVPRISKKDCDKAYGATGVPINNNHICAGSDLTDSCSGDSGGPLQRTEYIESDVVYVQHGIVSFGPRICGLKGYPGVYTKVSSYIPWILDNLKP